MSGLLGENGFKIFMEEDQKIIELIEQNYWNTLLQAIVLRYQSLTIISGLSTTLIGFIAVLNFDHLKTHYLIISIFFSIITAIFSMGRYIWLTRKDIKKLRNKIDQLYNINKISQISISQEWDNDCWVESLYVLYVISIFFLLISLPITQIF